MQVSVVVEVFLYWLKCIRSSRVNFTYINLHNKDGKRISEGRKSPQGSRLVSARTQEGEIRWMPSPGDGLVLVGGDHHARQGCCQVALQVGQDDLVVVAGGQQVERVGRKSDGSNGQL